PVRYPDRAALRLPRPDPVHAAEKGPRVHPPQAGAAVGIAGDDPPPGGDDPVPGRPRLAPQHGAAAAQHARGRDEPELGKRPVPFAGAGLSFLQLRGAVMALTIGTRPRKPAP